MLEKISWGSYWTVVVIVLAIYYLVLFVLLFQKGFFSKNRVNAISSQSGIQEPAGNRQPDLFGFESAESKYTSKQEISELPVDDKILMPLVHDLIQELKDFITDISERSFVKEEVIMGIQVIIKNYKRLEGSPYQKSINDFIKNECEDFCSIHFSEDDIKRIWLG